VIVEICGIDGSGKSTLIDNLRSRIHAKSSCWAYERVFRFRTKRLMDAIAQSEGGAIAKSMFPSDTIQLAQAFDLVEEAVREFHYDTVDSQQVYFVTNYRVSGLAEAIVADSTLLEAMTKVYALTPTPALTLFLRLPPEVALERIQARPHGDQLLRAESPLGALTSLSSAFERVIENTPNSHVVLDAAMPPEDLATQAYTSIQNINAHLAAV
jgi:thymidylate kinase